MAIGHSTLENQSFAGSEGVFNVAVGYFAGNQVTSGTHNTLVGGYAGDALTTGFGNVALGYAALSTEDAHGYNVAIGKSALQQLNAGTDAYNTAVGYRSWYSNDNRNWKYINRWSSR